MKTWIWVLGCIGLAAGNVDAASPLQTASPPLETKTAVFAGGCFWCMQPPFDALKSKGVMSTSVGYAGGRTEKPTYEQVSAGTTGHLEVLRVSYDPKRIGFRDLLKVFWENIDPVDEKGQFCDRGEQYTSAIFYSSDDEKKEAEASIEELRKKGLGKIVTKVLPLTNYFVAEDYHQAYYEKNPIRYKYYRLRCGRDARLKELWGSVKK